MSQHSRGGAAFGKKVWQLKVTGDVSVVPKRLPVEMGGYDRYFAVNCFSLCIIFIGRNGGGGSISE